MAISAMTVWRCRQGASDNNGGAYDRSISGAGTDYTDSDTAQLSLTDLATTGAVATVTSAAGGFTAAMVGNGIYIASGTNFTAGTYMILSVTDTNTAVLDRACATGVGSAGVGKVGGALALIATATTRSANGNTIMLRGNGVTDSVDASFTVAINSVSKGLKYVGYNGYPKLEFTTYGAYGGDSIFFNLFFKQVGTPNNGALQGNDLNAINCVFDANGNSSTLVWYSSLLNCSIINTGAQVQSSNFAVVTNTTTLFIKRVLIKDQGCGGILGVKRTCVYENNVIQNCLGDGIKLTQTEYSAQNLMTMQVRDNTIYNVTGHGIWTTAQDHAIIGNSFHTINGSGKNAIYCSGAALSVGLDEVIKHNNFYNCTTPSNLTLPSNNTYLDPQFVSAPSDLTPTNTGLRYLDGIGALM